MSSISFYFQLKSKGYVLDLLNFPIYAVIRC